jgi:hypothetical protein
MAEDIKPTPNAGFYNTKIPSLGDNANIQQALRMYHYGTDGSVPDDSGNPVSADSVAGYLKGIQTQIDALDYGSTYSISEPEGKETGFIWVDSDSSAPIFNSGVVAIANYQNTAPTAGLVDGMLWVDKDSTPLKLYVYDAGTTSWKEIGA